MCLILVLPAAGRIKQTPAGVFHKSSVGKMNPARGRNIAQRINPSVVQKGMGSSVSELNLMSPLLRYVCCCIIDVVISTALCAKLTDYRRAFRQINLASLDLKELSPD